MIDLIQLRPRDEHNRKLAANVRPQDWVNPTPAERYNLVVVGAGTAGLVTAAGAAGLGARVALIERELLGGDCLNVGCVPSKGVISAARAVAQVRGAAAFGVEIPAAIGISFPAAMERMRRLRAAISTNDSAARFRDLGVDVFLGEGRFTGSDEVRVGDATLRFKKAVIATGARAAAPPIPGLDRVGYLTNESIFSLSELPARLGVIGAGPIGCELAQAFARFGSEVYLVETEHGVLQREDRTAAALVEKALHNDGVRVLCCGRKTEIHTEAGETRLRADSHGRSYDQAVDQILVAVGRAPNIESLGLEAAGVEANRRGVVVNARLQTSNPRLYAAGDVCSEYQFTHAADFMARLVIRNALFGGRGKVGDLIIPWCTYTSPEVAHVGLSETQAAERGIEIETFVQHLSENDRAILEGEDEGFVMVHVKKGGDRIVGATIVARDAGDLISEITLAMTHGIGLKGIADTIHPYPTQAEAIRKTGDLYNRTRLTPFVKSLFEKWLRWTR
jgi:pyruvate/2-oxoglutarate dehydrogenase complex dihydrolipoamide dehydrogenase (E3) component